MTKEDIVKRILNEGTKLDNDSEIIKLLLEKKVTKNSHSAHKDGETFGSRMSDGLARVAGSWYFITGFMTVMSLWIAGNVIMLKAFDPYPFILLNLVLSCVAAIQAPVIMMSQNRQEEKDRIRAENDYKVNLKAELIVEDIHNKLEHLVKNQKKIVEHLKL